MIKISPASRIQSNLQELFQASVSPGLPYVRFHVTSEISALLSMTHIEESLVVDADKITPLPSMPASHIGMLNSRDHVFCLWDLAHLLNLPSQINNPQEYQVLVLSSTPNTARDSQKVFSGFAIQKIEGIMRLAEPDIQTNANISNGFRRYVLGSVDDEGKQSIILDPILLIQELSSSAFKQSF